MLLFGCESYKGSFIEGRRTVILGAQEEEMDEGRNG